MVQFCLGDIHTIALPSASFDVILSLDVWCHISQRAALLQRCATLLRAGGRLAFYDHVER
jgi:2-polyprenyl-3-methyl-5-hydroxy-6-metoxy-1,4-benzoquinol methylase